VVLCRVEREAAPAAADVEHALAGLQVQLRADELELVPLRLLERGRAAREDRAAVRHRLVQHEPEEVVGDVVVVAHRARVALEAVALAPGPELCRRPRGRFPQAESARRRDHQPRARARVE
jgi:hypothetical protein